MKKMLELFFQHRYGISADTAHRISKWLQTVPPEIPQPGTDGLVESVLGLDPQRVHLLEQLVSLPEFTWSTQLYDGIGLGLADIPGELVVYYLQDGVLKEGAAISSEPETIVKWARLFTGTWMSPVQTSIPIHNTGKQEGGLPLIFLPLEWSTQKTDEELRTLTREANTVVFYQDQVLTEDDVEIVVNRLRQQLPKTTLRLLLSYDSESLYSNLLSEVAAFKLAPSSVVVVCGLRQTLRKQLRVLQFVVD